MRTRIQDNMKMLRAQFRMGIRIGCFSSKCTDLILVPARVRCSERKMRSSILRRTYPVLVAGARRSIQYFTWGKRVD